MAAAGGSVASQAQAVLRARLCDPSFVHSALRSSPDTNYSKLKYLVASSVSEACNNSVLLLGPRGCGKAAVVDMVLDDLKEEHPDAISVIRLNGMLHSDDNCAVKVSTSKRIRNCQAALSRASTIIFKNGRYSVSYFFNDVSFCYLFQWSLLFQASSDDNTEFIIDILRECGLAHKTIIFLLEEFDLFAQGKQRLLYSLLDAMQSLTSQAIVIGVSCRLDADQLLEKRVRSRFSHRKLLFVPSSVDNIERSKFVLSYTLQNIVGDKKFKGILNSLMEADSATSNILRFLFRSVSYMDMESGFLSMESFVTALSSMQRQPKMDNLQGIFLVASKLEDKEQSSYNFTSIMKEYRSIQEAYKTSDKYASTVCFRAFEHLLDRELISFADSKGRNQALEYRPVKLLISSREIAQSLKSNAACPAVLQKLLDRERYM
ncbi:hypothetical protein PR202_ga10111 [Eleusine coracana subsp. coracana]|uniref:Origin of replication complex subunit 4 n=1 Tax=Eleusine coracana subsp. coracana TaxID=191504 RepID=A0AAV5C5U5_ELECO|nr:hypothetical protein PR202_ga10111 [Eleusine coracana subsp. coracana]